MKQHNCEYCHLPISISEVRAKKGIVVENDSGIIMWCINCGKLNIVDSEVDLRGVNGKS